MLKDMFNLGGAAEHRRVLGILFAYLFGSINKFEYRRQIGDRLLAKQVWSVAENNGYVLRECKLFAYAVKKNSSIGLSTSPGRFKIDADDVNFLRSLDLSHIDLRFKAYSLFDFDQMEGALSTSKELQTYIGKYISKKLIFIVRSYGVSREEIHSGMLMTALFAVRKQYPFYESELHAFNTMKTSIQNYGKTQIEFYTRDKRNALSREANGLFSAVQVPYDSLNNLAVMPEHEDELRVTRQSLITILPKLKPKAREFVQAAAGVYSEGFSLYLGIDNRDAVERWDYQGKYLPSLRSYLKVTEEQTTRLLSNLKKSF